MGRPKTVQKNTRTQYFENVTPLWVPPNHEAIETRYHDAIDALVEWVGNGWPNNETSNFFPMRHMLIKSCQSWAAYDWQSDFDRIEERRADAKHLSKLDNAFSQFVLALGAAPFRSRKKRLGLTFLGELCPNATTKLTNEEGIAAIERALSSFGDCLKTKDRFYARYGAIEYSGIPQQLPRREVAIALCLADRITFMRRDRHSEGTLCCPHKPSFSKNLPWKAIALFASAHCFEGDDELTTSNVQTLVKSLARKAVLVHWSGDL